MEIGHYVHEPLVPGSSLFAVVVFSSGCNTWLNSGYMLCVSFLCFWKVFFVKMSSHLEVDSRPASPWLWPRTPLTTAVACCVLVLLVFTHLRCVLRRLSACSVRSLPLLRWRSVLGRCFDRVDSPSLWHLEPGHYFHEPCVSGSQCSLLEFCFRRFFLCQTGGVPESPGVFSQVTRHRGFRHRGIFRTPPCCVEPCTMTAPVLSAETSR